MKKVSWGLCLLLLLLGCAWWLKDCVGVVVKLFLVTSTSSMAVAVGGLGSGVNSCSCPHETALYKCGKVIAEPKELIRIVEHSQNCS